MKVLRRVLLLVFILFVVLFVGIQVFRSASNGLLTETALMYTTSDRLSTVGVAVRGEKLIDSPKNGTLVYLFEDGAKVSAGSLVLEVYNTQNALYSQRRIQELDQEIAMLEDAQSTGLYYLTNTESLSSRIQTSAYQLMDMGDSSDFTGTFAERMKFLSLLNSKRIATERETDYAARISMLQQQRTSLDRSRPSPIDSVTMPETGFFSSVTDGYENVYTPENLMDMSVEQIQGIIQNTSDKNQQSVGKVITEFNWYFAVVVSASEAEQLLSVGKVTASFPTLNLDGIPMKVYTTMTVQDAMPGDTESPVAVILTSNYMNAGLSSLRVQNVEFSMSSYSGLRVSKEAVRFRDGVMGVYIQIADNFAFRSIQDSILFETEDYLLIEPSETSAGLQMYDRVVVQGTGIGESAW